MQARENNKIDCYRWEDSLPPSLDFECFLWTFSLDFAAKLMSAIHITETTRGEKIECWKN